MSDLSDLLNAVGLQAQRNTAVAAQITGNYAQIQNLTDDEAVAQAKAGEDDQIVTGQKAAGELKAQQNSRAFATAAGTNMDDTSEIMSSLGLQLRDANLEAIRAQKIVQDKASVKLEDDPIQYILNSITIGDDINYADQAQATADTIAGSLAKLNSATQQTSVTQNAIAETHTAATVQATTDEIAQKAKMQADQIKAKGLLYNIQGIQQANALDQNTLSNMFSVQGAIVADKHLQIAQEQLEEARWMHRQQLEKKIKEDQFDTDTATTINKGRAILGLPSIPAGKALQLLKMGGELGDQIRKQYESGAVMETTGLNVISENPGQSAVVVAQSGAPLAPGMKPVRDLLISAVSDVAAGKVKSATGLPVDVKDKNAVVQATDGYIQTVAKNQSANIKYGDNNNIYQAPDINSIIKVVPGVQQTPLYQTVLAPLVQTGMKEVNPEQVLSLTATAVKNGQLNFADASKGISALFSAAATTNNVTKDYIRVGLKPQTSYNTTVQLDTSGDNTGFGLKYGTKSVNLTDTNSVNTFLSKKLYLMNLPKGEISLNP